MKTIFTFCFLFSMPAMALVSSPNAIGHGQNLLVAGAQWERGKVEPNENTASFQKARINIYQLSYSRGIEGFGWGSDHFVRADYRHFTSASEAVAGQTFHQRDSGHTAQLSYGFNFIHELSYSAGIYASVSPLLDINKDKFSNPRVDLWSLGLRSGLELSNAWFLENSLHFGGGIPKHQNAYLALTQLLGWRLSPTLTLKFGPYAELDLQERFDARYDAAFSTPGRPDRIRSAKFGVLGSVDAKLSETLFTSLAYVQKIGGYDAPATNASTLSVGAKF